MCGRFTLTKRDFEELATMLDVEVPPEYAVLYRPRYNIAPTDPHWLLRQRQEERELLPATWGLVNSWAKDAKGAARQINARSETALKSRAYRDAFIARRCVVPADGFYEWIKTDAGRRPVWFHPPDDGLLLFASLYESWHDPNTGDRRRTFSILTTTANDTVAPVHDRMPVILPVDRAEEWLFVPAAGRETYAGRLVDLLAPAADRVLLAREVSPRANSVANDDAGCLEPAGEPPMVQSRLL